MNKHTLFFFCVVLMILISSCSPKVMVPPRVDLSQYDSVGLISFTSNAKGSLHEYATQQFLASITHSQMEASIIELGDLDTILDSVNHESLNPKAVQAIGEKYDVNAVITGNLDVSAIKPKVNIFALIGMKANVNATLVTKLYETNRGATIWTASGEDEKTVAEVSVFRGGGFFFDARDPEEAYGDLVKSLIKKVTRDLRVSYQRM